MGNRPALSLTRSTAAPGRTLRDLEVGCSPGQDRLESEISLCREGGIGCLRDRVHWHVENAGLFVSVRKAPTPSLGLVEVRPLGALARLSERSGRMILHAEGGSDHHFYLQDRGITYPVCLADPEPLAAPAGTSSDGAHGSALRRWGFCPCCCSE